MLPTRAEPCLGRLHQFADVIVPAHMRIEAAWVRHRTDARHSQNVAVLCCLGRTRARLLPQGSNKG